MPLRETLTSWISELCAKAKTKIDGKTTERFENVMAMAESIVSESERYGKDPAALVDLIRLLARPIQSRYMVQVAYLAKSGSSDDELNPSRMFFDSGAPITPDGKSLYYLLTRKDGTRVLHLNQDTVLPWTWNRSSMASCLIHLASGGRMENRRWIQDSNHKVEFWWPVHIGFVHGGNHSIMSGIIAGRGHITDYTMADMSAAYEHVVCDGKHYRRKHDNTIIEPVRDVESACIFEIGRMLLPYPDISTPEVPYVPGYGPVTFPMGWEAFEKMSRAHLETERGGEFMIEMQIDALRYFFDALHGSGGVLIHLGQALELLAMPSAQNALGVAAYSLQGGNGDFDDRLLRMVRIRDGEIEALIGSVVIDAKLPLREALEGMEPISYDGIEEDTVMMLSATAGLNTSMAQRLRALLERQTACVAG